MTDEQKVVDPPVDNSTPPATEPAEQPVPSQEDNTVVEPKPEEPEVEPEVEPDKEERYKQQLQGSKEEALKWMREAQQREKEYQELKTSIEQKHDDDIPVSDQDLVALQAMNKKLGYVPLSEVERRIEEKANAKAQEQIANEALKKFLSEYPEYNKVGDADSDKKWNEYKSRLATHFNTSDSTKLYETLKLAHNSLNPNTELERTRGESLGMAKVNLAEQAKTGSRASGEVSTPKGKQTPEQRQFASEIEEQLKQKSYYKPR